MFSNSIKYFSLARECIWEDLCIQINNHACPIIITTSWYICFSIWFAKLKHLCSCTHSTFQTNLDSSRHPNPTLFLKVVKFSAFKVRTKGSLFKFLILSASHNTLGMGRTQKSKQAHHLAVLIRESLPAWMNGWSILIAGATHSNSYNLIKIHLSMRDPLSYTHVFLPCLPFANKQISALPDCEYYKGTWGKEIKIFEQSEFRPGPSFAFLGSWLYGCSQASPPQAHLLGYIRHNHPSSTL